MKMENTNESLRIVEFCAENTKVLKAVRILPGDRNVVKITGKNRQGKSTVLDMIWAGLKGKKFIDDLPIRNGQDHAEIMINLGKYKVRRIFNDKGTSLSVECESGALMPSPQGFLTSCLSDIAHNPLEFMNMKPSEQTKVMQTLFPLPVSEEKIGEIAGLASKTVRCYDDKTAYLDKVKEVLYQERTENNREVARLRGVIDSINLPRNDEEIKPVSVADLTNEFNELRREKQYNDGIRNKAEQSREKILHIEKSVKDKNKEIEEIEYNLSQAIKSRDELVSRLDAEMEDFADTGDILDRLVDPDFTDINYRIATVDAFNKNAIQVINQRDIRDKAKKDLASAVSDSELMTDRITQLEAYKRSLIADAKLPLPRLGYTCGQVTYNELPIDQASTMEQIQISCAICLASHPEIGILTIDVGWNELDSEGKAIIEDFASRNNAQIWVTSVCDSPNSDGFFIQDGELLAIDGNLLCEDC